MSPQKHGRFDHAAAQLRSKSFAQDGGFIPMPDHRIPPDCSLAQFQTYIRIFRSMFGGSHA